MFHGHLGADRLRTSLCPAHYVDAWVEVADAHRWSADEMSSASSKQHLSRRLSGLMESW